MRVVYVMAEYSLHNQLVEEHLRARPDDELAVVKVPLVLRGKGRRETAERIAPKLSRRFLWGKLLEAAVVLTVTATPKMLLFGLLVGRHDDPAVSLTVGRADGAAAGDLAGAAAGDLQ